MLGELLVLFHGSLVGFVVPRDESFQRADRNLGGRVADDGGFSRILLGVNCGLVGCTLLAFGVFAVSVDMLLVGFWMAESNKNRAIN